MILSRIMEPDCNLVIAVCITRKALISQWKCMNLDYNFTVPALVQIMAGRRPGDKSFTEPVMVSFLTHICVTLPQWINWNHGIANFHVDYSVRATVAMLRIFLRTKGGDMAYFGYDVKTSTLPVRHCDVGRQSYSYESQLSSTHSPLQWRHNEHDGDDGESPASRLFTQSFI